MLTTESLRDQFVNFTLSWILKLLEGAGGGLVTIAMLVVVWKYGADQRKWVHLGTVAGVLFTLFLSFATWYRPNENDAYYEKMALKDPIPSFSQHITDHAIIYWENNPTRSWFALGRSNYISRLQTAGIIFSRNTAIEAKRRTHIITELGMEDDIFETDNLYTVFAIFWWGAFVDITCLFYGFCKSFLYFIASFFMADFRELCTHNVGF